MRMTLQAADKLAQQGIECEVVDVRSLAPLDEETFIRSGGTHRPGGDRR